MKVIKNLRLTGRRMIPTVALWIGLWFIALSYLGTRLEDRGGRFTDQPLSFLTLIYLGFAVPILAVRA
jgi:hypothetical protein